MFKPLLTTLLLVAAALGDEDRYYNPELNYRPENVTDLAYYLYAWKGSYVDFIIRPLPAGENPKTLLC